jgi:hypothetical protein
MGSRLKPLCKLKLAPPGYVDVSSARRSGNDGDEKAG